MVLYSFTGDTNSKSKNHFWCLPLFYHYPHPIDLLDSIHEIFFPGNPAIRFSVIRSLYCTITKMIFLKWHFDLGNLFLKFSMIAHCLQEDSNSLGTCGLHNLIWDCPSNLISALSLPESSYLVTLTCLLNPVDLRLFSLCSYLQPLPCNLFCQLLIQLSESSTLQLPPLSWRLQFCLLWILPHITNSFGSCHNNVCW